MMIISLSQSPKIFITPEITNYQYYYEIHLFSEEDFTVSVDDIFDE